MFEVIRPLSVVKNSSEADLKSPWFRVLPFSPPYHSNNMDPVSPEKGQLRQLPRVGASTEEIKEIVRNLNAPPFSMNLTLYSFDEKSQLELLELLNSILAELDSKHKLDIREEAQDATALRITEFLKVLNFPSNFDIKFQQSLVMGDKKVIYPILYYILSSFPQMKQRAYLAKYLVSIYVPEEFTMDEDMQLIYQEYKELQSQFQGYHQELEQLRAQSLPNTDLKKEIDQLENEKGQLLSRIAKYKQKFSGNAEFKELLDATSMLRKEQEEEARLVEKIHEQEQQVEWFSGSLLSAQQRLINIKKAVSTDTTAQDMLNLLKADVKKNREFCNERIGRELSEKIKRYEQMEQLISEPHVSQQDIDQLQNDVKLLQRETQMLEEKAKTAQNPTQDKLAIYKQQAAMASKKKEKTMETLAQLETDASKLEKRMSVKEEEYEKARGGNKFMGRDEFQKYAQSLRSKTNTFKQMKSQLAAIRSEVAILDRTEKLLRQKNKVLEDAVRNMERKQGIEGYTSIQSGVEEVSKMQQEINMKKGATLEEMSRTVEQLVQMKEQKKAQLAPLIQERKTLYARYQEVSTEYEGKKAAYERANAYVETERQRLEEETKRLVEETTVLESKYHLLNAKMQVHDALLQRATNEQAFQTGERRLSAGAKSIKDLYQTRMTEQAAISNEMRKNQKIIKETSEVNSRQVKLFSDLRKLLMLKSQLVKMDVHATGVARNMLRGRDLGGEVGVGGVNRLVLGD